MAEAVGLGNIRVWQHSMRRAGETCYSGARRVGPTMGKGLDVKAVLAMTSRVLGVIALAGLIAGCDRCGDWWGAPDRSQSCKGQLPAQR